MTECAQFTSCWTQSLTLLERAESRSLELMDTDVPMLADQDYQVMQRVFIGAVSDAQLYPWRQLCVTDSACCLNCVCSESHV